MDDPTGRQHLLSIPYSASGGGPHTGVSQLRWLSPGRLIFLGESVIRSSPCLGCEMDTVRSGLGVVIMDVDQSPISPVQVPSTDYASGVSPGTTEDEIYYTLGGDTRVYRRILSSGEVAVAHDFGAGGIARDVHVVGSRLAAVVGGRVAFGIDPVHGPTQWDSGGTLRVVNIQNGTEQTLTGPGLFRRPQLSPSGTAIVAEVYPLIVTVDTVTQDTVVVVGRDSDLYLYQQP